MKIAIVCYNIDWPAGGPRLLFSSAKALEKMGHKVVIYAPQFEGKYYKELWTGLDIRVVPPRYPFVWEGRPSFFKWIWKKVKQERLQVDTSRRIAKAMDKDFDIVNLHDYAYRIAPFYKKRNPKAKILWTSNDPPYTYLPKKNPFKAVSSKLYNVYRDWDSLRYFKHIDATAVLDDYNLKWCKARGLRATIVYLGVYFDKFYIPVKNFAEKAKRKEVRLFGLGALNAYRRYEDTIMAVKFLRDWGYNASAYIICNDTWNESDHRQQLLDLIRGEDLENSVRLNFAGATDAEIHEAQKESDVFVYAVYLPPPRDGFGFSIAVLEAMAAGLPVIICSTTTSHEVLKDGKTALFVDPMSPKQIAEEVKMLVDKPEIYMKIAEAGQRLVKEELTWEKYAKKLLALVQ